MVLRGADEQMDTDPASMPAVNLWGACAACPRRELPLRTRLCPGPGCLSTRLGVSVLFYFHLRFPSPSAASLQMADFGPQKSYESEALHPQNNFIMIYVWFYNFRFFFNLKIKIFSTNICFILNGYTVSLVGLHQDLSHQSLIRGIWAVLYLLSLPSGVHPGTAVVCAWKVLSSPLLDAC